MYEDFFTRFSFQFSSRLLLPCTMGPTCPSCRAHNTVSEALAGQKKCSYYGSKFKIQGFLSHERSCKKQKKEEEECVLFSCCHEESQKGEIGLFSHQLFHIILIISVQQQDATQHQCSIIWGHPAPRCSIKLAKNTPIHSTLTMVSSR